MPDWNELSTRLSENASNIGLRFVGVLVALVVAWIVAGAVRRWLRSGFERTKFDATLSRFFANLARYAIITLVVLGCMGTLGINVTSFAAIIAALGLAVGLAFQNTLANFASGILLLIFRPFRVGDYVEVSGADGTVAEIELFTTELITVDNRRIVVPNGTIFGSVIENKTAKDTRRVDFTVGVDYSADIDATRAVLEKAIEGLEGRIEDPPSQIYLADLGASSVDWAVRVWCKTPDYWAVRERMLRATKYALDEANIGIPYPQMDVHLDGKLDRAA